ncbi:MAG: AsmA family protein [Alphaproteobacteria bacterium]
MKRLYIILPVFLVAAFILSALIAPNFVNWSKYKPQAVDQVKQMTGLTLALEGDLGLSIIPSPRIYVENVTIASPEGSKEDHLIRVKRLDINIALMPLLSGKVDFSSINLVEPDIALEVFRDGKPNWMTPELQALTQKNPSAEGSNSTPSIALRDVRIKNGKFIYRDGKSEKPLEISDIDVDLSADSLQGPFRLDGSASAEGQALKIKGKTGKLLAESGSVAVNFDAEAQPLNVNVTYAGVVGLSDPYDVQGEAEITVAGLKDKLTNANFNAGEDSATIKGIVTGSKSRVEFKEMTLAALGSEFKGDVAATFSPVKVTGKLAGNKPLNIDSLMKSGAGNRKETGAGFLPPTIELPAAFEVDLAFSFPSIIMQGQTYRDVTAKFAKSGSEFAAVFAANEIPGKGKIDLAAEMKFASKSLSKTGAEIYSDPSLVGKISAETQNIAQTAEAMGIKNPALSSFKTGKINGQIVVTPQLLEMKSATVRLGEMNAQVDVAYSPRGSRPALAIDVAADKLDFDDLIKKFGGDPKTPQKSPEQALREFSLPYDVDFDIGAQDAMWQGQAIKGLRAQGTVRQNSLKFTNLSAQNFAGSSFIMEGGIGDLKDLKAIDVKLTGQSNDVKGVAKMAGIDPATLPQNISSASVNTSLSGDMNKLAMKAAVKALGGEFIASGDVANPMGEVKISGMTVQVKHGNMAEALRIFAPESPQYASWQKPLDFYAEIDTQGKTHTLRNIKADLAGASLSGNLTIDQGAAKPAIKGDLSFGDLVLVSGGKVAQARAAGKWSDAPMDVSWMNGFDADLSIKAKSITYETWSFKQPVLSFDLKNGTLQIRQMESGLYGGNASMSGVMNSNAGKGPMAIEGVAKFSDVSVEELAASLARGTRLVRGTGKVNLETTLKSTGGSQKALVSGLSGTGVIKGNDIVLDGFDLARFGKALSDENKPAETLSGLFQGTLKGGSTAFDTLNGNYTVSQGVVNLSKLDLDGPTALLATTGTINLPAWTLATNHNITLKQTPDVPPFTVKISGSLDNPGQTFGQGVLNDYVQRKLNRKLEKLITKQFGEKLGLPAPAAGEEGGVAPAPVETQGGATPVQPVQPVQQEAAPPADQRRPEEVIRDEAIQGVLKGLLGN